MECPKCHKINPDDAIFCSTCGQQLKSDDNLNFKRSRTKIYVLSVILAPLGIYWFFKYFRSSDREKRQTAYIALTLTLVAFLLSSVTMYGYVKTIKSYYDMIGQENIMLYEQLGY